MMSRNFLFCLSLFGITGALIFILAPEIYVLWAICIFILGILVGASIYKFSPKLLFLVCNLILICVIGVIVIRRIPMHSFISNDFDEIKISRIGKDWEIEIKDQTELNTFKSFLNKGYYNTMLKSGYSYQISICKDGTCNNYYMHGNSIGDKPGGTMQSVFTPYREGFNEYFEQILDRYKN
jgi:hypothetical protein